MPFRSESAEFFLIRMTGTGRNPTWKIGPISAIQFGKNSERIPIRSEWFQADPLRSGGFWERPRCRASSMDGDFLLSATHHLSLRCGHVGGGSLHHLGLLFSELPAGCHTFPSKGTVFIQWAETTRTTAPHSSPLRNFFLHNRRFVLFRRCSNIYFRYNIIFYIYPISHNGSSDTRDYRGLGPLGGLNATTSL